MSVKTKKNGLLLLLLIVAVFTAGVAGAAATVDVKQVKWVAKKHKLVFKAKGAWSKAPAKKATLKVFDADNGNRLFTRRLKLEDDGKWELAVRRGMAKKKAPCRVRVVVGDTRKRVSVSNAPARCEQAAETTSSTTSSASAGYVGIETARWIGEDSRLRVAAKGRWGGRFDKYERVRVLDAESGVRILSRKLKLEDDGRWELNVSRRLDGDVPCRVRVVGGSASAEANVRDAPNSCGGGASNQPPVASAGADQNLAIGAGETRVRVQLDGSGSRDPDGTIVAYQWSGSPNPSDEQSPVMNLEAGNYVFSLVVTDNNGEQSTADSVSISISEAALAEASINSTSAEGVSASPVLQEPFINNGDYALLAANDLGMHCADLDYRVFSILPPFNVVHAQVVRKGQNGGDPRIEDDSNIEVVYSATSNPIDPALSQLPELNTYKGNFWSDEDGDGQTVGFDTYAPLFFGLLKPADIAQQDTGLPVPDSVLLRGCLEDYLAGFEGPEGPRAKCGLGQQSMPGKENPYVANVPQLFDRFDRNINFFNELLGGVGLGGIVHDTNWFAADGVPMIPVDDNGRSNAYPLMRVQARSKSDGSILASTDVVLPVASEADCQGCHAPQVDCADTSAQTGLDLQCNGIALQRTAFEVMTLDGDGNGQEAPGDTALESLINVAKINILRLHDAKHGTDLDNSRPVQCATCHYTPALDLAQLGPTDSPATDQTGHITMSRAMHGYHGELLDDDGNRLFPDMPGPAGRDPEMAQQVLGETCYQCHPGKRTQCLRGAMAAGGVVCQDCHGNSRHVGNDFSEAMADGNRWPGAANLNKRVPWALEPGCQSCHTGDALDNLAGTAGVPVAADGIRLLKAYTLIEGKDAGGNPDGSEVTRFIKAGNKRFAENESLYRLSKGHGGVMCEGCHGSTHAIFPNPVNAANDNIAAKQLQGHAGTITECSTCHEGDLGRTLNGPHGMHPVGNTRFARDHESFAENNGDACRSCHGQNGEGTVLSKTASARALECKDQKGSWCSREGQIVQVTAGTQVGCTNCHEDELNGD